jgi:hypothetical protein
MEDRGWRMAGRIRRIEDGGWRIDEDKSRSRMEDRRWKIENG